MPPHENDSAEPELPGQVLQAVKLLAGPLAVLRELDRAPSLRAAAQALNVPQPTLSRQLQRWQEELGIALVRRDGRVLMLTEAGHLLASAADEAVVCLESTLEKVIEQHPNTVRLGTLRSLSSIFVPGFAQRLADYDGRSLSVHEGSDTELLAALRHDELDLVLISPPPQDQALFQCQELLDQEMVLTIPLTHRLAATTPVQLQEVADEPFLLMSAQYSTRTLVDDLFRERDVTPHVALEADDVRTLRHYVALEMGISVLPYEGFPDRRVKELRIMRPNGTIAQRTVVVAWRRRSSVPSTVRTAIELLSRG